jgi:hypothetical protein
MSTAPVVRSGTSVTPRSSHTVIAIAAYGRADAEGSPVGSDSRWQLLKWLCDELEAAGQLTNVCGH